MLKAVGRNRLNNEYLACCQRVDKPSLPTYLPAEHAHVMTTIFVHNFGFWTTLWKATKNL